MAFVQLPPTLKQIAFGDWGLAVRIYRRNLRQHGVCTCWAGWLGWLDLLGWLSGVAGTAQLGGLAAEWIIGCSWGATWRLRGAPEGSLGAHGVPLGALGAPLGDSGALGSALGALGRLEGKIIKKPQGFSSKSEIRGLWLQNREGTLTIP